MTKEEFDELIMPLHFIGASNSDLGHGYWTMVIQHLKEMYE